MNTLTLGQAAASYKTWLGFVLVMMIFVGLPSLSYSQNQSADGLADKLQDDTNPCLLYTSDAADE